MQYHLHITSGGLMLIFHAIIEIIKFSLHNCLYLSTAMKATVFNFCVYSPSSPLSTMVCTSSRVRIYVLRNPLLFNSLMSEHTLSLSPSRVFDTMKTDNSSLPQTDSQLSIVEYEGFSLCYLFSPRISEHNKSSLFALFFGLCFNRKTKFFEMNFILFCG